MNDDMHYLGIGASARPKCGGLAFRALGSCVGLIIVDSLRFQMAGAHVFLPQAVRADCSPGAHADMVVAHLLGLLKSPARNCIALAAGGASMFRHSSGENIGQRNADVIRADLHRLGIPIVFEKLGGHNGCSWQLTASGLVVYEHFKDGRSEQWLGFACAA